MNDSVCPACESRTLAPWFGKQSKLDGKTYAIRRCAACRSAFALPRPDPADLERLYASEQYWNPDSLTERELYELVIDAQRGYPLASQDAERFVRRCKDLSPGTALLDIGAGHGFLSHEAVRQGFQVTAIEPASTSRAVFRLTNGFEPLGTMLDAPFVEANRGRFDALFLTHVLEHMSDPGRTVGWLRALLKPEGVAAISVPHFGSWLSRLQGKRDMFIVPPEHLNYFSLRGLSSLFSRHGFVCRGSYTLSRIDTRRVTRRLAWRALGAPVALGLAKALQVTDRCNAGTVANAFFQWRSASPVAASESH